MQGGGCNFWFGRGSETENSHRFSTGTDLKAKHFSPKLFNWDGPKSPTIYIFLLAAWSPLEPFFPPLIPSHEFFSDPIPFFHIRSTPESCPVSCRHPSKSSPYPKRSPSRSTSATRHATPHRKPRISPWRTFTPQEDSRKIIKRRPLPTMSSF